MPLTAAGNAVVYGSAGSGKTHFLTDAGALAAAASTIRAQVHVYLLDFEAETLRAFQTGAARR